MELAENVLNLQLDLKALLSLLHRHLDVVTKNIT